MACPTPSAKCASCSKPSRANRPSPRTGPSPCPPPGANAADSPPTPPPAPPQPSRPTARLPTPTSPKSPRRPGRRSTLTPAGDTALAPTTTARTSCSATSWSPSPVSPGSAPKRTCRCWSSASLSSRRMPARSALLSTPSTGCEPRAKQSPRLPTTGASPTPWPRTGPTGRGRPPRLEQRRRTPAEAGGGPAAGSFVTPRTSLS